MILFIFVPHSLPYKDAIFIANMQAELHIF